MIEHLLYAHRKEAARLNLEPFNSPYSALELICIAIAIVRYQSFIYNIYSAYVTERKICIGCIHCSTVSPTFVASSSRLAPSNERVCLSVIGQFGASNVQLLILKKSLPKIKYKSSPSLERTDRDLGERFMHAIASELESLTANIKFLRNLIALLACYIRL